MFNYMEVAGAVVVENEESIVPTPNALIECPVPGTREILDYQSEPSDEELALIEQESPTLDVYLEAAKSEFFPEPPETVQKRGRVSKMIGSTLKLQGIDQVQAVRLAVIQQRGADHYLVEGNDAILTQALHLTDKIVPPDAPWKSAERTEETVFLHGKDARIAKKALRFLAKEYSEALPSTDCDPWTYFEAKAAEMVQAESVAASPKPQQIKTMARLALARAAMLIVR
jgi:hypothetical protein